MINSYFFNSYIVTDDVVDSNRANIKKESLIVSNSHAFDKLFITYKNSSVSMDTGFIFESPIVTQNLKISNYVPDQVPHTRDFLGYNIIYDVEIDADHFKTITYVKFMKIQEALASMGGIISILKLVFGLILLGINKFTFSFLLFSEVYLHGEKEISYDLNHNQQNLTNLRNIKIGSHIIKHGNKFKDFNLINFNNKNDLNYNNKILRFNNINTYNQINDNSDSNIGKSNQQKFLYNSDMSGFRKKLSENQISNTNIASRNYFKEFETSEFLQARIKRLKFPQSSVNLMKINNIINNEFHANHINDKMNNNHINASPPQVINKYSTNALLEKENHSDISNNHIDCLNPLFHKDYEGDKINHNYQNNSYRLSEYENLKSSKRPLANQSYQTNLYVGNQAIIRDNEENSNRNKEFNMFFFGSKNIKSSRIDGEIKNKKNALKQNEDINLYQKMNSNLFEEYKIRKNTICKDVSFKNIYNENNTSIKNTLNKIAAPRQLKSENDACAYVHKTSDKDNEKENNKNISKNNQIHTQIISHFNNNKKVKDKNIISFTIDLSTYINALCCRKRDLYDPLDIILDKINKEMEIKSYLRMKEDLHLVKELLFDQEDKEIFNNPYDFKEIYFSLKDKNSDPTVSEFLKKSFARSVTMKQSSNPKNKPRLSRFSQKFLKLEGKKNIKEK